jgi:hypothetical protein
VGSTGGTSYNDNLSDAASHTYTVRAYISCGTSGTSGSASGYAQQVPSAPGGVAASQGGNCGYVYVTWNPVSGATGYYVYRDGTQVGATSGTSYNDNPTDTSSHSYTVRAYDSCGTSGTSGSASGYANAAPPTPTGVAASIGTYCGYVHVTWDSTPRATGYSVYRDGGYIGSTGATGYDDYPGDTTSHTYSVQASNSCGTSPVSGGSAGYVNAAPPTPTGIAASTGTYCGYVHVTWDSAPRATGYLVYRDGGYVGPTGATGYDDYPGDTTSHTYSVQASNSCGTSGLSGAASGYVSTVSVSTSASPFNGGTTTGGGTYPCGTNITVTAMPNSGYTFVNWTEGGSQVSADASYTFVADADRNLAANFVQQGAPLVVINTLDSGPGSLRQVILNATAVGGGTILFSNVTGTITLTSGELVIGTNINVQGPGSTNLAVSGSSASRVFNINSNATASISGLTIQNGSTNGPGGALYNLGSLVLSNCIVMGSSSHGVPSMPSGHAGLGGGIYNGGTMAVAYCTVTNNFADYFVLGLSGAGGLGGGIYNAGVLTLDSCVISSNWCADVLFGVGSGLPASGGGIYNTNSLTINLCSINDNHSGKGHDNAGDSQPGNGGAGGGVYNGGTLTIINSTANGNSTGAGGSGLQEGFPGGTGGDGGGFWNGGTLFMTGCTVSSNTCGNGGPGGPYTGPLPGGTGGSGGGICNTGTLALTNCTIAGNVSGNGGIGSNSSQIHNIPAGGNGGSGGSGGAIWNQGPLTLLNCTISGDVTGSGGAGGSGSPSGSTGAAGSGGGIGNGAGVAELLNTLIAVNSAGGGGPDVSGSFTSQGYNLIGNTNGSSGFGTVGDLLNVNPQLGPLQNNGGPTPTRALLPGSPAIDAGTSVGAPQYDQRGVLRPQGAAFDIGAFEFVFLCPGDAVCDGIPDSWRAQYFGGSGAATNNLSCAICDADGTGQNNMFKYVAGLNPTNPASVFMLQIQNVPNQPTHKNLIYGPIANGCTYVLESTTDLVVGVWSPQAVSAPLTNVNQVTVMDANATSRQKFYRVNIYNVITNIVVQDSVGDGIPDSWRAQYFPLVPPGDGSRTNGSSCATCDADGTGQDNLFKYVAGLDPTNPASVFVLNVSSATNQFQAMNLNFNPLAQGRTYTPEFNTNLVSGVWLPLTTYSGFLTNGNQVTITDTNPIPPQEFYRIGISLP